MLAFRSQVKVVSLSWVVPALEVMSHRRRTLHESGTPNISADEEASWSGPCGRSATVVSDRKSHAVGFSVPKHVHDAIQ